MATMKGYVPANAWEREVYRELKRQLPPDWIVMTNVTWSKEQVNEDPHSSGYVRDGEADFVVLVPALGFVVLEVKGSREVVIAEDGCWYRREPRSGRLILIEPRSPPNQASAAMHELKKAICQRAGHGSRFPGLFGYLVVYPQGRLSTPPPPLHDPSTLVTSSEMQDLTRRIRTCLTKRGSEEVGERFTPAVMAQACDVLTNRPFEIVRADLGQDMEEDSLGIELLTRQQQAALTGIFALPRVAVTGPAGSGKTLLAIWRLAALVEEGRDAVYLCYNKKLAEHLRAANPGLADNIHGVDKWLRDILLEAGVPAARLHPSPGQNDFFDQNLPNLVLEHAHRIPASSRMDAIIIDEGQDFGEPRLIAVQDLLRDPDSSTYLYFADEAQDIYSRATAASVGAEVLFALHHNCRNTVRINGTANRFASHQVPSLPGMPEGVSTSLVRVQSTEGMVNKAWELARDFSQGNGSVAILSPRRLENSVMNRARRGHGLELSQDLGALSDPGKVYFSTIKSFKGIEAASIILVEAENPLTSDVLNQHELYVACTRARLRLAIISATDDPADFAATAAIAHA
jgi:hypothetical protein